MQSTTKSNSGCRISLLIDWTNSSFSNVSVCPQLIPNTAILFLVHAACELGNTLERLTYPSLSQCHTSRISLWPYRLHACLSLWNSSSHPDDFNYRGTIIVSRSPWNHCSGAHAIRDPLMISFHIVCRWVSVTLFDPEDYQMKWTDY